VPREVFYEDADISFQYVIEEDYVFLHCDVTNWSPSVLKRAYRVFGDFLNTMRKRGMTKAITITPNPRFAKLFGGETIEVMKYNKKECEVIRWVLV
jgi:hypothetical protein